MAQIPRGPEHLKCPLWQKSMEKVCHTCPWWQQVRGKNPNTGDEIDKWECAIALLPLLTIEVSQQTRQAGAATESFRNEMVMRMDAPLMRAPGQLDLIDHIAKEPRRIGGN